MTDSNHSEGWEPIIGLEIHAQLNTKSKLFSAAPNRFGDEPNTNITEVCTGQPGALPVLNAEAVRKIVQFGCAINAQIAKESRFDRKSYFYPDSPRNFQITQYTHPIVIGGTIIAEVEGIEKSFAISRAHLEDDAGTLKHFPRSTGIDYNRAGAPLIEIISEPCMRTPKEASAYAMAIKSILEYIDASDCNMDEGSLRIDVNVSVRRVGEKTFRNKIEIKNMNSFNFLEMALQSEIKRQINAYLSNPSTPVNEVINTATYRWDHQKKEVVLMRRKETAEDYRYFPEPDLLPIFLTDDYIEKIRSELPELPYQREKRYVRDYHLAADAAYIITAEKWLADYFEEGTRVCSNARALCNWIMVEFAGRLKDTGKTLMSIGIPPDHIGTLVNLIDNGIITGHMAKRVADEMLFHPLKNPAEIVAENPQYRPVQDLEQIDSLVDRVLQENSQSIADFLSGKDRAFAFLVGQVMKLSKGKADPLIVTESLKKKLKDRKEGKDKRT